ncbi:alpha/beta fold hydrolase [Aurantimonas aggregata]|uniref:Alpha/beta fold hydrolase n=1 Tax=Aurantimonas aggregata TaxID=2047720 RepID=A0A6L9MMY6_9HYPH|nr:alpha/beta hydrolase [Aurantimonas aggregata]NDV89111.1 alpha/beta fold hydrolase [Aurantimonas aggregata]
MNILLLPGFMLDAELWVDLADALGDRHRLFYGDLTRYDTIGAMASGVLSDAPESFVLIGFSMGGYVAREIARMAPDRVQALILIATSGRPDTPAEVDRKARSVERVETKGYSGLGRLSVLATLHATRRREDPLVTRVSDIAKRLGGDVFLRQAAHPREGDLDRIAEIACPTLIIASADDCVRSVTESQELNAGIPQSELVVIEGVGHMIPLETPTQLASIIASWISPSRVRKPDLAAVGKGDSSGLSTSRTTGIQELRER